MKKIGHFLNIAVLALFASCIILLFGGIEFRAAEVKQSVDYQEPIYQFDDYGDELNPRSDYYSPHDNMFLEENNPEIIRL